MKKLLSVFLFILIPLLVAVPGYMGWQTQRYMEDMSRYIDAMPQYSAQWREYRRGWFSSDGVIAITVDDVPALVETKALTLPFNVHLKHGPIFIKERLGVGWFDLEIALLAQQEEYLINTLDTKGDGPIYQLTAQMDLLGNTAIADRWLPFDYHDGDFRVSTNGYEGWGSIGVDRVLDYTVKAGRFRFINDADQFDVDFSGVSGAITAELARLNAANVAPGSMTVSVGRIESNAENGAQTIGFIEGLTILAETWLTESDERLNSKSSFTIKGVNYPSIDLALSDVFLDLAYKDISLAFIEQYQVLLNSAPADAGPSYWQEHVGNLILQELLPASPKMLLERFQFNAPEGQFVSNANLSIEGDALANAALNPQNPIGILPYLIFSFSASVDEPLARRMVRRYVEDQITSQIQNDTGVSQSEIESAIDEQTQQMIDMFVAQKFVEFRAQKYSVDLKYEKGEATLNT